MSDLLSDEVLEIAICLAIGEHMNKEKQLEQARRLAEAPDVIDLEQEEPMLYLWQVEDIIERGGSDE